MDVKQNLSMPSLPNRKRRALGTDVPTGSSVTEQKIKGTYLVVSPNPYNSYSVDTQCRGTPYYWMKFGDGNCDRSKTYKTYNPDFIFTIMNGGAEFPQESVSKGCEAAQDRYFGKLLETRVLEGFDSPNDGNGKEMKSEFHKVYPCKDITPQQFMENIADIVKLFAITDFSVDEEMDYFADQVLDIVDASPWYCAKPHIPVFVASEARMQNSAPFHPVGQAHLMSPAIRDRPIDTSRLPKNDIINFINNLPEATFITPIKNGKVNDLTQMGSIGRCTPGYVFVIFRRVMRDTFRFLILYSSTELTVINPTTMLGVYCEITRFDFPAQVNVSPSDIHKGLIKNIDI